MPSAAIWRPANSTLSAIPKAEASDSSSFLSGPSPTITNLDRRPGFPSANTAKPCNSLARFFTLASRATVPITNSPAGPEG